MSYVLIACSSNTVYPKKVKKKQNEMNEMNEIENKDKMRSTKPSSYCEKLVKKGKTLAS